MMPKVCVQFVIVVFPDHTHCFFAGGVCRSVGPVITGVCGGVGPAVFVGGVRRGVCPAVFAVM